VSSGFDENKILRNIQASEVAKHNLLMSGAKTSLASVNKGYQPAHLERFEAENSMMTEIT